MKYTDKLLLELMADRAQLVDYATTIVGDRSRSEDVVQEAYMRLRSIADDRPLAAPRGYLRRIVRNLSIDFLRGRASERKIIVAAPDIEAVAENDPSPEATLAARQELRIVMRAIEELPGRTRRALELHRFEGRKLAEIAGELGISIALAHKLVYEGLEHCRRRLAEGN